jgi:hypothetical protein
MKVFTLLSRDCYTGTPTILGVFENMEAALEKLRIFSSHVDVGEEYHIECFNLITEKVQKKQTADIMRSRAKYRAQQKVS